MPVFGTAKYYKLFQGAARVGNDRDPQFLQSYYYYLIQQNNIEKECRNGQKGN